jgi:hypothetical protein
VVSTRDTETSPEEASTSLVVNPTDETTSVLFPEGALIVKEPSAFVTVATFVPLTVTVAKPIGELSFELITFPVMDFCAKTPKPEHTKRIITHRRNTMQSIFCLISNNKEVINNIIRTAKINNSLHKHAKKSKKILMCN